MSFWDIFRRWFPISGVFDLTCFRHLWCFPSFRHFLEPLTWGAFQWNFFSILWGWSPFVDLWVTFEEIEEIVYHYHIRVITRGFFNLFETFWKKSWVFKNFEKLRVMRILINYEFLRNLRNYEYLRVFEKISSFLENMSLSDFLSCFEYFDELIIFGNNIILPCEINN